MQTADKQLRCELCEKTFRRNDLLVVDKWSHAGEKPFKCMLCEKIFS